MQHMFAKTYIGYVIIYIYITTNFAGENCRSKINVEKDTTN